MKYTIDGHFDLLSDVFLRRKNGEHEVIRRLYLPSFQKGNVTGIVASIFVDSCYLPYGALEIAMEQIASLHCEIRETPDCLMLCTCADDFIKAAAEGKIGILLSFEGAEPVSSPLILHAFYAAGVRGLGLAWSRRNAAADGCDFKGNLKKGGLTQLGESIVKEAESLRMMLDLSHLSDEGVEDVLSITSCPVIASHSNARALAHNNRNLTDAQMCEIARRGGIAGINGCSIITADKNENANMDMLTAHLNYLIDQMGDEHVGFGFDFCDTFLKGSSSQDLEKMPAYPFDILSGAHADIPAFLEHLRKTGYSKARIDKIAGENWIRTFRSIFGH